MPGGAAAGSRGTNGAGPRPRAGRDRRRGRRWAVTSDRRPGCAVTSDRRSGDGLGRGGRLAARHPRQQHRPGGLVLAKEGPLDPVVFGPIAKRDVDLRMGGPIPLLALGPGTLAAAAHDAPAGAGAPGAAGGPPQGPARFLSFNRYDSPRMFRSVAWWSRRSRRSCTQILRTRVFPSP